MNCCKKNNTPVCENECNNTGFQSYFFIVLIIFILLAIIMGGATY